MTKCDSALALQGLQAIYPTILSNYDHYNNQGLSHYELSQASYTKELN
jgi:ABC-type Fe2+-enterobactin transport system substrate-binding protein